MIQKTAKKKVERLKSIVRHFTKRDWLATAGAVVLMMTIMDQIVSSRQQKIIALRKRIADLESMISRCEYDEKMRKLDTSIHGYNTSRTTDDMRQAQLKYTYQSQYGLEPYHLKNFSIF